MSIFYKFRIYCETDNKWEYIWDTVAPTICPTTSGHTVNSNSVNFIEEINSKTIDNTDVDYKVNEKAVLCDTTNGNIDVYLRKASKNENNISIIKKIHANYTLTIHSYDNTELIDASPTKVLTVDKSIAILQSDGTKWITKTISDLSVDVENNIKNTIFSENKGDLIIDTGDDFNILPVGTNNQILMADSTQVTGIKWVSSDTSTQTLTNKTLTATTNNITANGLRSSTTTVNVSAATAPTSGEVLKATSSTSAIWQKSPYNIVIPIFTNTSHEKSTSSLTYITVAHFIFDGTTRAGTPTNIKVSFRTNTGTKADIRIYDVTNSTQITEKKNIGGSLQILDFPSIGPVSSSEAIWEVQILNSVGNTTYISSVIINF